jgi:hypothetical protein
MENTYTNYNETNGLGTNIMEMDNGNNSVNTMNSNNISSNPTQQTSNEIHTTTLMNTVGIPNTALTQIRVSNRAASYHVDSINITNGDMLPTINNILVRNPTTTARATSEWHNHMSILPSRATIFIQAAMAQRDLTDIRRFTIETTDG